MLLKLLIWFSRFQIYLLAKARDDVEKIDALGLSYQKSITFMQSLSRLALHVSNQYSLEIT